MQKHLESTSKGRFAAIRILALSLAALCLGALPQAGAQNRIKQAADDSVRLTLKGNVHPLARAQNDLGAAPLSQPMNHVKMILQRSPAQEAALDAYLASLQAKGSPNYHRWLTPAQFGKLYGPTDDDIQKLTGWLQGHGFTIDSVAAGRTHIDFTGSVAQVQDAFHTSIHSFRANGVAFLANTSNPQIPAAFAAVVGGIAHLNTVALKPMHVQGAASRFDSQTHRFVPAAAGHGVHAQYSADLNGYDYLVAVPADAATIYDTPNQTLNAKYTGTTSYDGTGVTIGVAGQSDITLSYVTNYQTLFLPSAYVKAPVVSNLDAVGIVPGDDAESYLDNEIASGLAPGATLHFYTESATTGDGVIGAAEQAIADNTVDVLSVSYGACELDNGTSGNQEINSDWQQAAAQGITVVVSAGDTGSAGCDAATDSSGNPVPDATGPLAVNGLASTPYNIAVGGTDFDVLATNFSNYVSAPSSQTPATYYRTALGYIPEATWNDSTYNNTTLSQNVPVGIETGDATNDNISAGSGGQSNCAVNTTTNTATGTCTSGYAKPSWQTGSGVPNDNVRDIPDVSLLAGDGTYGGLWAVCDGNTAGFDNAGNSGTANCVADSSGDFYTDGFGGTSTATPAFAGIMALVVQKTGQRQGQAAPIIYGLFNSTPSAFHDTTVGNNSVPCSPTAATTATCLSNSQGYDYESGFNTNAGYDLATGLGSIDATAMITNWASATGSFSVANVTSTPSATSIAPTAPLTFTITVTAIGGATGPAGTVTVTDGTASGTATLAAGAATVTIPANTITATGDDMFTTTFTPAAGSTFATASSFVVVDITSVTPPTGSFTLGSTAATIASPGQAGTSTVTITPASYTGTVNLTCALASAPANAATAYNPACALASPAVAVKAGTAATTTATFSSTAATSALAYPRTNRWYAATGGAALAGMLFFGIPARRRGWKTILGMLIFLVAMAGVGCGGGGSGSNTGTSGTTTGAYTFTVTGTDSVTSTITSSSTVTVTVN